MTVPLVILAIPAAVLGLVVGLPPEGGWLHTFLQPVFYNVEKEHFVWAGTGGALMVLSLAVVVLGISTAYVAYLRRPELPAKAAARVPWAYEASLPQVLHGRGLRRRRDPSGHGVRLVAVGLLRRQGHRRRRQRARLGVGRLGRALRPLQTGRAQSYAFGVFGGLFVLVILIRYFWGA